METVSMAEARRNFSVIIMEAGFRGKRVVVQRHGKPVAAVVSFADLQRLQELEDRQGETWRRGAMAALEAADRVREMIAKERNGEYLPDSAEVIREIREERTDELLGLR